MSEADLVRSTSEPPKKRRRAESEEEDAQNVESEGGEWQSVAAVVRQPSNNSEECTTPPIKLGAKTKSDPISGLLKVEPVALGTSPVPVHSAASRKLTIPLMESAPSLSQSATVEIVTSNPPVVDDLERLVAAAAFGSMFFGSLLVGVQRHEVDVGLSDTLSSLATGVCWQSHESAVRSLSALGAEVPAHEMSMGTLKGDRQENQDVALISKPADRHSAFGLIAVCDGHGPGGQLAANMIARAFPAALAKRCFDGSPWIINPQEWMTGALLHANSELNAVLTARDMECGTTAVIGMLLGSRLIVANVGDSRAILVRKNETTAEWEPHLLSHDHSFDRADEVQRIGQSKGKIILGAGNMYRVIPGDGYPVDQIRRRKLALAMTRALGHPVLNQHGISPDPEFVEIDLLPGDRIVFASDGLWDVLRPLEVALICSYHEKSGTCTDALLMSAQKQYDLRPTSVMDNTTISTLFIK